MNYETIQSERVIIAEPCPKCGKEEKLSLSPTDLKKAKISGVAGKAFSHGDHTLIVFYGSKGSHRGQYIYENDVKLFFRNNKKRVLINNNFVYGVIIVDSIRGEFDDSCCPIFAEKQTAFMISTIMSSLTDLRVPDGKLVTLNFAGMELFVISSKEKTIIVFPREDKDSIVKQMAPSLLNRRFTAVTINEVFRKSLIEDIMFSKNRFVRLSKVYPHFSTAKLQQNQLNTLNQFISRELGIAQSVVDQIVLILAKYADGSRNLRILFDEWVSNQVTDDWNVFLTISSLIEKNGYLMVKEKRFHTSRLQIEGMNYGLRGGEND
ncbi:MAG: hypothetical protein ACE5R6_01075 [Candidatus Heimdallarchaeota archaeon]